MNGVEAGRQHDTGQTGKHRTCDIDGNRHELDIDAGETRNFRIAADGIKHAPLGAEVKEYPGHSDDREHQENRCRQNAEMTVDCQHHEPVGKPDDLLAVGDHVRDAARGGHHRQRRDEGWNPEKGNEKSDDQPAGGGRDERHCNPRNERQAGNICRPAHDHHGKRKHRTNRKVDTADQDDEGHADGHDAKHGDLIEDVKAVAEREKRIGAEA